MAEKEIYYEMLWDCTQCEAKGLLGDSHRHCPMCGAAQDPKQRYFPKPGAEVEAKNHQYVGVDWSCAFCMSPNSAAAAHCTNCGAGQDGTKPVVKVEDVSVNPSVKPQVASVPGGVRWLRWVLALAVLVIVVLGTLFFKTQETTATVTQKTWSREIQIEKLVPVSESAWCEAMPTGAYAVTYTREQRSSKKVPDGQECREQRVDQGDGTFVKRQECTPRYREEPVYDKRCHFQVNRWRMSRSAKAEGDTEVLPAWPSVGNLNLANRGSNPLAVASGPMGSEREGPRRETYVLKLASGSKLWTCMVSEPVWTKYAEGRTTPLKVRLTGGADCDSLK